MTQPNSDAGLLNAAPDSLLAFGVAFSLIDTQACAQLLAAREPAAPFAYVATPNAVHVVNFGRADPRFRRGLDEAWLRLCDSQVVRGLARLTAGRRLPLATGSDLTARLFAEVIGPDDALTIIGGDAALCDALRARYGLQRIAQHVPPFGFIDDAAAVTACIDFAIAHPARFVLIVCGAPQSEVLAAMLRVTGRATGIGLCVGASLLFLTGRIQRAPRVMQACGLEWLHRLAVEPRRMLPRLAQNQLPLLLLAVRYAADPRLRATHAPRPERPVRPGALTARSTRR